VKQGKVKVKQQIYEEIYKILIIIYFSQPGKTYKLLYFIPFQEFDLKKKLLKSDLHVLFVSLG